MTTTIRIAAVGDILMWGKQIASAKRTGESAYSFDEMFQHVAPYLRSADLTIGNLETTLSGRETRYQRRNPRNGYPMFNCPDELAPALKKAGFDVLTTANNHCMDRGASGLKRTLNILDKYGISHTGTFRTASEAQSFLIKEVKGVKVGILAYTYGTNGIPVPSSSPWMVNRIRRKKMLADLQALRGKADLVIVALHFGKEFHRYPSDSQRSLVRFLMRNGADVILGAHPHVLQPMAVVRTPAKRKFVIYSLGNFISDRMLGSLRSQSGVILQLTISKPANGQASVTGVHYIPTYTHKGLAKGRTMFRVLPVKKFLSNPNGTLGKGTLQTLRTVWRTTTSHLKGKPR
ncbi:CapA family protein [Brevibacillus sp. SYP-B805]|uniref:CapA family protein n=1 Tax=Brevibacillus sp. SYP-B805 TaxID=1578199 RepID=UPI0013EAA01E|nr:CapA family protein [Brevibacillus sp. SYP-B805]NGQ94218.1 CapA family protein [Brevibacillus sp. SYP-B805]